MQTIMKKIVQYSLLVILIFTASCDKGFDELNKDKTLPTAIDPIFQLNNAVVFSSFPGGTLNYELGIVQQIITPNSGVLVGANFNQDNRDNTQLLWQNYYRNVIKNTSDVINRTRDVPERSNVFNMARIVQANAYIVLTDTYGDIPYEQAGAGFSDNTFFPAYDAQQDIYPKIIQELKEASAGLTESAKMETADIMYGGNIGQWKKFGYSLLLRAGMRLSKVDPALAAQTVQDAFAGGVITANIDNAAVKHNDNYTQGMGNTLNSTEAANFYLAAPFVDYLKQTADPRLRSIAVRYKGATSGGDQVPAVATTDPAEQFGMPMGKDNKTAQEAAVQAGLAHFYDYSQVDRTRMAKRAAPVFLVTAAQSNLLLAEARERGWITSGTVQEYYTAGVRAHMEQMASYDPGSAVAGPDIDAYLLANPFDAANALKQINTQYWIASFLNGPEAWANFRRSGYPELAPNPYPASEVPGGFIRRLTYPNSEISVNRANVDAAIARMGADNLATRVWWDKP
jgi:hypothetical protein